MKSNNTMSTGYTTVIFGTSWIIVETFLGVTITPMILIGTGLIYFLIGCLLPKENKLNSKTVRICKDCDHETPNWIYWIVNRRCGSCGSGNIRKEIRYQSHL